MNTFEKAIETLRDIPVHPQTGITFPSHWQTVQLADCPDDVRDGVLYHAPRVTEVTIHKDKDGFLVITPNSRDGFPVLVKKDKG